MLALFQKYFWVFLISMVPLVELRGAIPVGVASGLPLLGTYLVSIVGNMLPVPVIILFSKQVLLWCCKLPGKLGRFFQAIYDKGMKAGDKMQKKAGRGLYFALFFVCGNPTAGHRCLDRQPCRYPAGYGVLAQCVCRNVRRTDCRHHYGYPFCRVVWRSGHAIGLTGTRFTGDGYPRFRCSVFALKSAQNVFHLPLLLDFILF